MVSLTGSTTTSTENPLWDLQAQHLPGIFDTARNIYNQGPVQQVADFDPTRAQGINLAVDAALGPQQQLAQAHTSGLLGIAGGTDPATQRLAGQAAAASQLGAAGAGALGGARAQRAANAAAGDVIANRQLQALSQIPAAQQSAVAPAQTLTQAGKTFQDYNQDLLTAAQPFNWLNQYRDVIGSPQAPTTSIDSTKPGLVDTISNITDAFSGLKKLGNLFNEGGEVGSWEKPVANYGWQIVNGRPQLVEQQASVGGWQPGAGIGWDSTTNQTVVNTGGSDGGGGTDFTPTTNPDVISTVPAGQRTGNFYQDNQLHNPDINYDNAYVASNNQIVGTLDPHTSSTKLVEDAYGIDPDFYTEQPIHSSSDFRVGSSTEGTDYTVYDPSLDKGIGSGILDKIGEHFGNVGIIDALTGIPITKLTGEGPKVSDVLGSRDDDGGSTPRILTNQYGSKVSEGYGIGQVDPALAAAAGYTANGGGTPLQRGNRRRTTNCR